MIDTTDEIKIQETVGARIRELRVAAGIKAIDLADQAKISQGQLSKIETGKAKLSINILTHLTRILHRPLAYLFQTESAIPKVLGALSTLPTSEMVGTDWFIKEIKLRTSGKIALVQMTPNELGTAKNQIELLQQGVIDIFIEELFFFHHFTPIVNILTIPFVFNDDDHLTSFLKSDYFDNVVRIPLHNNGIKLLNHEWTWCRGLQWVLVSPKPIITPMDVKGLRVRVYDSPAVVEYWKGMGAVPVIIPWAKVKKEWSKGKFDILSTRKLHVYPYGFCQFGRYITLLGDICPRMAVAANLQKYEILPPALQKGIETTFTEAGVNISRSSKETEEENETLNMAKYQAIYLKVDLTPWKEQSVQVTEQLTKNGLIPPETWLSINNLAVTK